MSFDIGLISGANVSGRAIRPGRTWLYLEQRGHGEPDLGVLARTYGGGNGACGGCLPGQASRDGRRRTRRKARRTRKALVWPQQAPYKPTARYLESSEDSASADL